MFDRLIPIMIICIASTFYFVGGIDIIFPVSMVVLLIYVYHARRLCFDIGDVLLALGTFSYYVFTDQGIDAALYYSIIYVVMYQVGKMIVTVGGYEPESKAAWMAIAIGVARMLMGFLHYSVRPEGANEQWVGWGEDGLTPRTGFEMYLVIMAALLGYFLILTFKTNKWSRILGGIGIILSAICVYLGVSSEGRFALGCCICGTMAVLILFFIESGFYKKIYGKIILSILFSIAAAIPIAYIFNLFGYRTLYENSYLSESGGFVTNTRFTLMLQQIKLFKDYPLGHCEVPLIEYNSEDTGAITHYVHNFWLDIGRRGGVIPAALYIAFSLTNIISMIKVAIHGKTISRYAIIAAFIGAMLYSALEATIFGKGYWSSIILMGGLIRGIADDQCENTKSKRIKAQTISFSI